MTERSEARQRKRKRHDEPLTHNMEIPKAVTDALASLADTKNGALDSAALSAVLKSFMQGQEELKALMIDPEKARQLLVSDRSWFVQTEDGMRNSWYGDYAVGPVELIETSPVGLGLKVAGGVMVGAKLIDLIVSLFVGGPEDAVETLLK